MKIERIELYSAVLPLRQPITIATGTNQRAGVAVAALHSGPFIGWGGGSPSPLSLQVTFDKLKNDLKLVRPFLLGRDIESARDLHQALDALEGITICPPARAALDLAFYDLLAAAASQSVLDLLTPVRTKIITSLTIGIKDLEQTVSEAKQAATQGFRALKLKIGLDVQKDIERIKAVRAALGTGVDLWVDGNQGYTLSQALHLVEEVQYCGLEFIEQPLPKADLQGLREFHRRSTIPLMLDESVRTEQDFVNLEPSTTTTLINIKLMKCGGIYPAIALAQAATRCGIKAMVGCMCESALSIRSGLAIALSQPAVQYADLDSHFGLIEDISPAPDFTDGNLLLQPGFTPGILSDQRSLLSRY